ncbi:sodium:solute symporter family transporter [Nonlabens ponticola]|uniref:Sodium:solute symporter n=1 Tax=Nonlabens ponticola TaxID=2496866 RepID=A0A3S9MWI1_9FLAO|nr:sodium:solute symporter [Nonlabens ponticola]AZQ43540.1 sodium:solute symporter [Nonlabens ponticola]
MDFLTQTSTLQWLLIIASSVIFFILAPYAKDVATFFKAQHRGKAPSMMMLTGSLIISWIFAKSITNAANLGLEFGLVGGVAYAGYYLSFAVAGVIIYQLRTSGGYNSIHHFLTDKFDKQAVALFSILISFRLFNEVWSNTMVIGTYFGDIGSTPYYAAILVFTVLTLAYTLKGGLSSSIFTDVIQMVLFSVLLVIILSVIFSKPEISTTSVLNSGTWSMELGLNLFFAAILQSFSYPFHDPVLTDRGFITSPKVMRKSFLWAALLGGVCIVLFSLVGVYAQQAGLQGQAAVEVAKKLGVVLLLIINFIMITSAASTLDSTFSSFSKLLTIDLNLGKTVTFGRVMMVLVAVLGTIPVFLDAEILSATTISGTMVIGLTPVFLLWKMNAPKISYFLSVICGLVFGILLVFQWYPQELIFTTGKYADLLWLNVYGIAISFLLFLIPSWIKTS